MLFGSIQTGNYFFPSDEWSAISACAKDLIRHLLVREPRKRYTAADVLKHPWVCNPPAATPLATPHVLVRYADFSTLLIQYLNSCTFSSSHVCNCDFCGCSGYLVLMVASDDVLQK
jgi:serine/threonine protein kinase